MRSGELITADESHAARRGREDGEGEREREKRGELVFITADFLTFLFHFSS